MSKNFLIDHLASAINTGQRPRFEIVIFALHLTCARFRGHEG